MRTRTGAGYVGLDGSGVGIAAVDVSGATAVTSPTVSARLGEDLDVLGEEAGKLRADLAKLPNGAVVGVWFGLRNGAGLVGAVSVGPGTVVPFWPG